MAAIIAIKVQREDFDIGAELSALSAGNTQIGGVASFTGLVRDIAPAAAGKSAGSSSMTLEHYPGMTEKQLTAIAEEASRRWPLDACLIIHRFGKLLPGDRIVLVATASAHREAALEACAFLIDWLKTKAPFWKLEDDGAAQNWVAAKDSDDAAAARWALPDPRPDRQD
jgi:molybdopterin synthase catalytic subunit